MKPSVRVIALKDITEWIKNKNPLKLEYENYKT